MTNLIILVLANGKEVEINYSTVGDLIKALNEQQLFQADDPRVQSARIKVPNDLPKSRLTEIKNGVSHVKIPIVLDESLSWERGGIGGTVDWDDPESLKMRGVDITKPDNIKAVQSVIAQFEAAKENWQKLRKAGIVSVEGAYYIKRLEEYQVKKS